MSAPAHRDTFETHDTLQTPGGAGRLCRLDRLEAAGLVALDRMPYSIRVLLENVLRNEDGHAVTAEDVRAVAAYDARSPGEVEIPFRPSRVVLQDFTGVPAVVDLAALRSALARAGGDATRINPRIPVDLVIDHSVQVDHFGAPEALAENARIEFARNQERYRFLRWGQQAFDNFRVVPPGAGIVHQVNLEYLASVVTAAGEGAAPLLFPDTVVGTDSHTTMINGLGVLGWGVGGIEAEAVMLGQAISMLLPEVVGVRLLGALPAGATATDLVLRVTELLRARGVVGRFVEFFGAGLAGLTLPDRATLANMAPEYGATMGFFPVDEETLRYLRSTGRSEALVGRVEAYCRAQRLFRAADAPEPVYTDVVALDLGAIEPSLAGPRRPQDRVALSAMKGAWREALAAPTDAGGFGKAAAPSTPIDVDVAGRGAATLDHGSVVIAAITSCTNTSNPSVLIAAGLVAQKAVAAGLRVPSTVKTSLAPGSRVVADYLEKAGLQPFLDALGFNVVGFGCMTCVGNSGPLDEAVVRSIEENGLAVGAVTSANRNFEGRVHPLCRFHFLASPPLVVAYALAGSFNVDLIHESLGYDDQGGPVFLSDIWPSTQEILELEHRTLTPEMYCERYADADAGCPRWQALEVAGGATFAWDDTSTYIRKPPFFADFAVTPPPLADIEGARPLAVLGDSITTDHISPVGSIHRDSCAGRYLLGIGVGEPDFNSFGARRVNHDVILRGTFGNLRLRNEMVPGVEGGFTRHLPSGEQMFIYDAAMRYAAEGVPLVVVAGSQYGTGSARDWAAKGTRLLGVAAVIAESLERIHRSNLVGMGVLPLQFKEGTTRQSLAIDGSETFDILGLTGDITPGMELTCRIHRNDGSTETIPLLCRLDTPSEVDYYRHGGILDRVLRKMLGGG